MSNFRVNKSNFRVNKSKFRDTLQKKKKKKYVSGLNNLPYKTEGKAKLIFCIKEK